MKQMIWNVIEECDVLEECKKITLFHYFSNHLPDRKHLNKEFI